MSNMASRVPAASTFKVSVYFEPREDGGLRAYSNDVPGFVLSYADCDTTLAAVVPVLETLLSDMFDGPVRVKELNDIRSELEDAGMIARKPRRGTRQIDPCHIPSKREYVTERVAA
jgi:hypothetical protein